MKYVILYRDGHVGPPHDWDYTMFLVGICFGDLAVSWSLQPSHVIGIPA